MFHNKKRKRSRSTFGTSLKEKSRFFRREDRTCTLEIDPTNDYGDTATIHDASGVYGSRRLKPIPSSLRRRHTLQTPWIKKRSVTAQSTSNSTKSHISRFSRGSTRILASGYTSAAAVHIVCAISENLARETCVASMDAGSPASMHITKQGNGQTYAETVAYLEMLKPHEVLLNDGRRHSPLARKIIELYNVSPDVHEYETDRDSGSKQNQDDDISDNEPRYGRLEVSTVVKFISRACFDQTKGAELLLKVARDDTYDAAMVEEYILLSSTHAVLHYVQQCLGATFMKNSVQLNINAGGNNRMTIDRATMLQLELLVNAKTGKVKNSLIGTIDCTKTTVGSRLLRSNLMSPPARVDTINTRLELVDLFLHNAEFFYAVLEHLNRLPDVDRMLSNAMMVPRKVQRNEASNDGIVVNERVASKGIAALVYIKSTLQALPSFAADLQNHLHAIQSNQQQEGDTREDFTVVTDRSSLLVGLGGGLHEMRLHRHHLLHAIIFAMTQPSLSTVLKGVSDIFTETTSFTRNSNAMRHQECFALKCEEDGMMSVLRKAFLANVDDIYKKADEYAEVFGLSVSVRYSTSRGYFIAIPADIGTDLPVVFLQPAKSGRYINCSTEEINSLNTRAQDNVHDLLLMTHDRIQDAFDLVRQHYDVIATLCDSVALLDMCHSFADNVLTHSSLKWCRPDVSERTTITDDSTTGTIQSNQDAGMLIIRNGRYPIQSTDTLTTGDGFSEFVPNDTFGSDEKTFTVITGINGSGKSTYLKQIAIITILAHCGSYVSAESAKIPIRDRVCCRIGNTDDQEHNISTFLLEMKESAFICNNATERSLVLIDELGRATSNEDGVAIAWSMSEYLLKKRSMTFFVTHYPQLSSLASIYPSVQNIHLGATVSQEPNGEISYTHKALPGPCSVHTDYGVKLSAVCGWPSEVVENATKIQNIVEGLLPEESLCHQRPLQQLSNTRTKGYAVLSMICQALQGLIIDEKIQSLESIRSDLINIHEKYIRDSDNDLLTAMDQLLSREPRSQQRTLKNAEFVTGDYSLVKTDANKDDKKLPHVTMEEVSSSGTSVSDTDSSSIGSHSNSRPGSSDLSSASDTGIVHNNLSNSNEN